MPKALKLRGEHHVNDKDCHDDDLERFARPFLDLASLAVPTETDVRWKSPREKFFSALNRNAQRHTLRLGRNSYGPLPAEAINGVGRTTFLGDDNAGKRHELAAGRTHINVLESRRGQPSFALEL